MSVLSSVRRARAVRDLRSGEHAYRAGRIGDAKAALRRSLRTWSELAPGSARVAECLNWLGRLEHEHGDPGAARELFVRALESEKARTGDPPTGEEAGNAFNNLGRLAAAQGELDEAVAWYGQALAIFSPGGAHTAESAVIVSNLGTVHESRGEYDRATEAFTQALQITGPDGDPEFLATCRNNLGSVLLARGEPDAAVQEFGEALTLCRKARRPAYGAVVLANLGHAFFELGDLSLAREHYTQALKVSVAIDAESLQTAGNLMALSRVPLATGDLDAAADLAGRAVDLCASVAPGTAPHAVALATLATVRQEAGDLSAALDLHRRALAIQQAIEPRSAGVATALNNLGTVYQDTGDLTRALDHYERARDLQRNLAPNSVSMASMHGNVGGVLLLLGEQEKALDEFAAARAIDEKAAPDSPQYATDLGQLGGVHAMRGELDEALRLLTKALELDEARAPGSSAAAVSLSNLAWVRQLRGEHTQALELADRAVATHRRASPGTDHLANTLELRAESRLALGDPDGALADLLESADLVDGLRVRSGTLSSARDRALTVRHITFHKLAAVLYDRGDHAEAFRHAERARARALADRLAERDLDLTPADDAQRELLDADRTLRRRLAALSRQVVHAPAGPDRDEVAAEIRRLEEELAEAARRLQEAFPAYREVRVPEPATAERVQAVLDDGETLLAYTVTGEAVYGWRLDRDGIAMTRLPVDQRELARLVTVAVETYRASGETRAEQLRAQADLGRRILHPLAPGPGTSRVIVVPEGLLARLPFELLPLPGGELLGDRYAVSSVPSATVLVSLRSASTPAWDEPGTFAGFGDPEFPPDWRPSSPHLPPYGEALVPLPGARQELAEIARMFGSDAVVKVGAEATEGAVRAVAPKARFVHFATHGVFDALNPLYSGLVLSPKAGAGDDVLQVHEMLDLRLRAQVVVCSTCDSGHGEVRPAEGMIGMSRALLAAGAHSVLLTLWPVRDRPTRRLMARFYEALLAGDAPAEALHRAKAQVRRSHPRVYADPATWAAFVLVGG